MLDRKEEALAAIIFVVFVAFTILVLPSMLGSYLINHPEHLEQEQ